MEKFNGVTFFEKPEIDYEIYLDASLKGLGGVCGKEVYHAIMPPELATANIATLEMYNILVAIRLWGRIWKHKTILFRCDNEAVVAVLNSGKTRDPDLAEISRNIFMQCALDDINLQIEHIPGRNNQIADLLSRWEDTSTPEAKLKNFLPDFINLPIEEHHLYINKDI